MDRPPGTRTCLYEGDALDGVMDDMARRTAALLAGRERVAVIGILRRGAPLADRLCERLVRRHGLVPPLRLDLQVKRYADDLTLLHPETRLTEDSAHAALDLEGCSLLEYLARRQPAEIRVAVLVDRGVCVLPVHADVVGRRLEVTAGDVIECNVPPYEPDFRIELLRPLRAG